MTIAGINDRFGRDRFLINIIYLWKAHEKLTPKEPILKSRIALRRLIFLIKNRKPIDRYQQFFLLALKCLPTIHRENRIHCREQEENS